MFAGGFGSLTFASFLHSCLRIKTNKPSLQPSSLRHSSGFEGFSGGHDERKERKSDFENSEDDKRTIIASLKKKAINASSKFRHSLKKRRNRKKNGGQINSVSIEDVWDAGELQAIDAF
nr:phosphatidylinositol/phosphatidylcholine transfer protein sfh8 [Quercus suber]